MFVLQLEDPAIRWQMALYRDLPNHCEDTSDPEKTVERVLDIAHVLFHLDQVCVCCLRDDYRHFLVLYIHIWTDVLCSFVLHFFKNTDTVLHMDNTDRSRCFGLQRVRIISCERLLC